MVTQNRVPAPQPISCPNCGGRVELRGFAHTRSAVCIQCCTIIDTSTPELRILQRFDQAQRERPVLPLGSRGRFEGKTWEAIGFQVRTIYADGIPYSWHEYLLFNPYAGFRYLTFYDGHWSLVRTLRVLPAAAMWLGRKAVSLEGRIYGHFQTAEAVTTFVMGEFPWAVRVGEKVEASDYVSPPYVLSSERDANEINWSQGVYLTGDEVWKAFGLKGSPPAAHGVYLNQPNPHKEKMARSWRTFLLLVAVWAVLLIAAVATAGNREVFRGSYRFVSGSLGETSFVTPVFNIPRDGNVEVEIRTDLDNNWAYFNMALLREDGALGFDFGREVSFYHGSDADGSWIEGSRNDTALLARVPAGKYYLRIEPEMDAQASARAASGMSMHYEVIVRNDVPRVWPLFLALPLLLIAPLRHTFRSIGFETARWSESDYGAALSSSSGDDE